VGRQQVLIDWDWGAGGIWTVREPDQPFIPAPGGHWGASSHDARDRYRAWRGRLTDELIDCLQAWNDDGDTFMGRHAHQHSDAERIAFWGRGRDLAEQAQQQLGDEYEVHCRTPPGLLA
jgi:hypothetical protein